ncbi:hypothetical protein GJ744_009122 [Endocarpon pusillum]|uniref:Uncharacterized protein n=1 Tax=Endocarpon pusillum TaxID=364733 RepID=A0A8H7E560_9EURO|nr:hypothetical protein GJ744_009122 [Endocarpon pusillum]
MTGTNSRQEEEEELPVHHSLILYFTRCGCTYYHTTPHQIPRDDREPANDHPSREMVPDGSGALKPMMVRKASIEGNCRGHDLNMMLDILEEESRPPDPRPDDDSEKRDDHLRLAMVGSETARKYRAMNSFNAKWSVQFRDGIDPHMPLDRATFQPQADDAFTEEEKKRFPWIIGKHGLAAIAGDTDDVKTVLAAENPRCRSCGG